MTETRALLVDAFTDDSCAGNAAGVVPDAGGLTDDQMQAIAAELGASETAFLRPSDAADRRLRYFTPTTEVDLCGHATIASHAHLYDDGALAAGEHTLETNVGVLDIEVAEDGTVWMAQNPPTVREVELSYERVAEATGTEAAALRGASDDIPLAVADTGLPFLIVPITYLSDLGDADPDFDAVEALADDVGAAGVYMFSFDALDRASTAHGRAWVPGVGVDEDPVTGTASGAAGAYLARFGAFDGDAPAEMVFEQGHFVDRPGRVRVRVAGDAPMVGGRGVSTLDGTLAVPAETEEEILEA
ncbi:MULTISPECIES: PhzF family phenazine biosynthesis protein [Halobacterium]|uniref:PhzF family phenazine biosynthesis protein n=1 Tax=Halobacterium TaxID=2239 RepID=UPI001962D716|nr:MULTISPECIES: PhzF family phenazine biosynthesis protein [Halobacterium]MCF2164169.1 PhzF family phenazine biosynthesis protein [Halobacterium salinarum]MCF2167755.1 PhzF family phenazine biosynthesis protein [Halobacterium salinarum]MCF2239015.1 PhzF family phenazine biosynthesis protein [Halobacterium salinarum]QRY22960.1 PhzF family phenazine biosynthesis protein [Halobacterium sp. GSL-19]WJK64659.1 PhzF family phenazine biosynthesis protein [Halobacterium salinarum]